MSDGSTQSAEEALFKPYDQFILFGDSITQMSANQSLGFGFQAALQDAYSRQLDVINRGFGGYNTAHAIKVFPKFFPKPETATVRFMTIFFGANDATVPGNVQHIPVETYKENLRQIIQHPATVAQNPRILILTPPPVNEYQLEGFDVAKETHHPSRTVRQTELYSEAAREVAASLNIVTVDLWAAFMTAVGWKEGEPLIGSRDAPNNEKLQSLFTDGLHLTGDGYRLVYEEVMKAIKANWPDQDPEVLPMVFPAWTEAPK
ncbi:SGNH/GDSL hydrolase family protein [Aspergillus clavatus NRRL 1]|uniref:GDSL Lipase/Acylhydrolase family protein n=1 Tax=Aspergillus clavatus (strain ATCC 1007 / CBS 513.65 / DSM 816 / NCTC 3887 / NRRL 1 / QM 1276 / 107) TaxID=344612 RepID=A1CSV7_ASPCL|nr:GDSL Lipase/Acylhydrolase family protein [Aspergillus clavatus NRRL 1]EAW06394.1 GDSL Lipase/Acylhydrolase family protein [Aspergillus clavatus NRRL 1]